MASGPDRAAPRLRLKRIAAAVGAEVVGRDDVVIRGLAGLADAGTGDLVFIDDEHAARCARGSHASAFLVAKPLADVPQPQLVVPHPRYAMACIAQRFFAAPRKMRGIASPIARGAEVEIGADTSIGAFVALGDRVRIGARVVIYSGVYIGDDCAIGDDSVLYPNVVVMERCTVGRRVIIHAGTVIGSDGFGFVEHEGRHHKVPQLGSVSIEDDVELGANVTIDRATFGCTTIKRGTKIDNLVQIAHNVTVGEDNILCAQVGIAGSTTLGAHVMAGGQAGIAGHVEIGEHVTLWARSGVSRSVSGHQQVSGAPAMPHEESIKALAALPRLPLLRRQLKQLQARVEALEARATRGK
ncbi:MAG: UDP-3-O-(3-hydroxymyristoyl)glucosamine N-acyltransferase [Gammaproteobacteria bacterium]